MTHTFAYFDKTCPYLPEGKEKADCGGFHSYHTDMKPQHVKQEKAVLG